MKSAQLPLMAELSAADTAYFTPTKFSGTDNPRHLRVILALLVRSRRREDVDHIAGAANGPDLIAELRHRGLAIPCDRVPAFDRDGLRTRYGVYYFTDPDRRAIQAWLRTRAKVVA
ncbi:hypothetical protein QS306_05835 [Paraburkholderia bonniea]|uniref:hypothetical protein n=1 Tax=Paraburkholderia bonniea TaxID=2152891 RepID=UPI002573C047|nr:hypothetical protein [Paraburkholderia bonniea]WJF91156.1 hypothetical protein QS306_05835 [Paraburkholderia bonniea]WJF94471.1 hypothetical protein QS308_05840 [Paraburkholderia bonniea]